MVYARTATKDTAWNVETPQCRHQWLLRNMSRVAAPTTFTQSSDKPEKYAHELEAEAHHMVVRDVLREEERTHNNSEGTQQLEGRTANISTQILKSA